MRPTVIQFTGAQSTGKSSVLKELKARYSEIQCIGEVSRTLLAKQEITALDISSSSTEQMLINAELLYQYYERLKDPYRIIIAERSAICCLAYARLLNSPTFYMLDFTERFLKATLDRKEHDLFTFYFPVSFFIEDGIRNKESAEKVDKEIQKILQEFQIPHYIVPLGSIEQRTDFVKDTVAAFKESRELYKV